MPETSVPVTTVPKPRMAKARSIGKRKYCEASFSGTVGRQFCELGAQLVQARAGGRAHRHHGRVFQKRAAHEFTGFQAHQLHQIALGQVGLGEDHDALPYA